MDLIVGIWLSQQSDAKGTKVGPEKKVERVEGVGAAAGMLHIVLTTKFAVWREFNTTIVEKTFRTDLGIVLIEGRKR